MPYMKDNLKFLSLSLAAIVSLATIPALYAEDGVYEGAPCGCFSTFECEPGWFCSPLPAPWICVYADAPWELYPSQNYCS